MITIYRRTVRRNAKMITNANSKNMIIVDEHIDDYIKYIYSELYAKLYPNFMNEIQIKIDLESDSSLEVKIQNVKYDNKTIDHLTEHILTFWEWFSINGERW